uniref:Uncharacterized protein n=1 Tax=Arundo donax TaxID=35708 RepID=A0A0A9SX14_ARUDO
MVTVKKCPETTALFFGSDSQVLFFQLFIYK